MKKIHVSFRYRTKDQPTTTFRLQSVTCTLHIGSQEQNDATDR